MNTKSTSFDVFAIPAFRSYQLARFTSILGVQTLGVAIAWQVYSLTKRPLDLGYVGLAEFLPQMLLSLVAGQVADRFRRRNILVICHAIVTLVACSLLAATLTHQSRPSLMFAMAALLGVARTFGGPAGQALMPSLVPAKDFDRAIAWGSSLWQLATIGGPTLGGLLYSVRKGPDVGYAVSVCLLATSVVCLAGVPAVDSPTRRLGVDLRTVFSGLAYVVKNRIVLGAISLDLFAVLLGGAVALLPVFASTRLDVGPWGLGILRSAPAVGALLSALVLAQRPIGGRAGMKMFAGVFTFGLCTIVFGLSQSFFLSLAALAVSGAADMVSVVVRQTLIQKKTPDSMRGRVSAVNLIFIGASNELGEFESGVTAAWLGTVPAVVLGGIGTCVVVVVWTLLFPSLRKADRLDELPLAHDEESPTT